MKTTEIENTEGKVKRTLEEYTGNYLSYFYLKQDETI